MCISQAKWSVTCRYVIFPVSLSKSWIHFIQDWSASTDWWTGVTWSCSAYGWISSKIKVYMIRFWFWIEEFLYMLPLIPVFFATDYGHNGLYLWSIFWMTPFSSTEHESFLPSHQYWKFSQRSPSRQSCEIFQIWT